jgi:AcrR family transcriptional regulator
MSAAVITYDLGMGRWEPNAQGRLEQAAMELYAERGFEQTTVAAIAERAGLTERTFFRHYADKREVLFPDGATFQRRFVDAVAAAPQSATPMEAVADAIEAAAAMLDEYRGRDFARHRQQIIVANPELQERELTKLAAVATAVAGALRARGVSEPLATLTAEVGITVFRVAFGRWVAESEQRGFVELIRESLVEVSQLSA